MTVTFRHDGRSQVFVVRGFSDPQQASSAFRTYARNVSRTQEEPAQVTFCLGINVQEGLVAIADTRLTSGNECITARKVAVFRIKDHPFFVMTSGLRSVRDKSLIYFEQFLEET